MTCFPCVLAKLEPLYIKKTIIIPSIREPTNKTQLKFKFILKCFNVQFTYDIDGVKAMKTTNEYSNENQGMKFTEHNISFFHITCIYGPWNEVHSTGKTLHPRPRGPGFESRKGLGGV